MVDGLGFRWEVHAERASSGLLLFLRPHRVVLSLGCGVIRFCGAEVNSTCGLAVFLSGL